ncbi:hypothetical protein RUND412_002855 [Rhizina undulata]
MASNFPITVSKFLNLFLLALTTYISPTLAAHSLPKGIVSNASTLGADPSAKQKRIGKIVGIVIGTLIGVMLLAFGIYYTVLHRRGRALRGNVGGINNGNGAKDLEQDSSVVVGHNYKKEAYDKEGGLETAAVGMPDLEKENSEREKANRMLEWKNGSLQSTEKSASAEGESDGNGKSDSGGKPDLDETPDFKEHSTE